MSQELQDWLRSWASVARAKGERPIPGATVTIEQWQSLVVDTHTLFDELVGISRLHFEFLDGALQAQITICPPSKGLAEVNQQKLLTALEAAEKRLSELLPQFPDKADLVQLTRRASRLREAWTKFAASDFDNEQVAASVTFTLKGPRSVVERIITLVRELVDKETVSALVGYQVGFVPEITGDVPIVLHDQSGPFPLFARGNEVTNLLNAMHFTVVPTEQVLRFAKESLVREIGNLFDGEDNDNLAVNNDVTEGTPATA